MNTVRCLVNYEVSEMAVKYKIDNKLKLKFNRIGCSGGCRCRSVTCIVARRSARQIARSIQIDEGSVGFFFLFFFVSKFQTSSSLLLLKRKNASPMWEQLHDLTLYVAGDVSCVLLIGGKQLTSYFAFDLSNSYRLCCQDSSISAPASIEPWAKSRLLCLQVPSSFCVFPILFTFS